VGGLDSMGFESIFVSKASPDAEFLQKAVIDANETAARPDRSSVLAGVRGI
jgi:hypothetical protein